MYVSRFAAAFLWTAALSLVSGGVQAGEAYRLGPQDRLRLTAYEWRPQTDVLFEWKALNGEFTVTAAGLLSLPLVGEISAGGLTAGELAQVIGSSMAERFHLGAPLQVGVDIVQYRPFYITGGVEKPGAYPYQPGLTVLKAVTLAGGLGRAGSREQGEALQTALQIDALLLRRARFKAEIADGESMELPAEIVPRKADPATALLIAQEETIFRTRRNALLTQIETLNQLKAFLEQEIASLQAQIDLKKREVDMAGLQAKTAEELVTKGLSSKAAQFERERLRVQVVSDELRLKSALLKARQDMSRTDVAIAEARNQRQTEAAAQLQVTEIELRQARSKYETLLALDVGGAAGVPTAGALAEGGARSPFYVIVRERGGRVEEVRATESMAVEPGDTVKVMLPKGGMNAPPVSAALPAASEPAAPQ